MSEYYLILPFHQLNRVVGVSSLNPPCLPIFKSLQLVHNVPRTTYSSFSTYPHMPSHAFLCFQWISSLRSSMNLHIDDMWSFNLYTHVCLHYFHWRCWTDISKLFFQKNDLVLWVSSKEDSDICSWLTKEKDSHICKTMSNVRFIQVGNFLLQHQDPVSWRGRLRHWSKKMFVKHKLGTNNPSRGWEQNSSEAWNVILSSLFA